MPASKLLQCVKEQDFDGFESLCLEALENGQLRLTDLIAPFRELDRQQHAERAAVLGQMVLENADADAEPAAALEIARIALLGDPRNEDLRSRIIKLYTTTYSSQPGFQALLDASGLTSGRPARNALRVLDVCLSLKIGDPFISRTEGIVVEIAELDLVHGLIALRTPQRPKTVTPAELASEYERIAPDDFRVLRAFKPERLTELLESDPAAVVIGLLHAHGDRLDQDVLRNDLVPKYMTATAWTKWWSSAKTQLQRNPHVIIEGRSPVLLQYTAEVFTLDDQTWETFSNQHDPADWLATLEGYLREKKKLKEELDIGILARCKAHLEKYRVSIERLRPSEAFACALVELRIDALADGLGGDSKEVILQILRACQDPAALIRGLTADTLWTEALAALAEARPEDAPLLAAELFPIATAPIMDHLIVLARKGSLLDLIQTHVDTALADPVDNPEIIYWLWKGPKEPEGLHPIDYDELFAVIVQTLSALGRTLNPDPEVMKRFRGRVRTALALRDHDRAVECIRRVDLERAVTLRGQLDRLEGVGDNLRLKLLSALREAKPEVFVSRRVRVEPWADPNVLWNTAEGIKRKTEERDHLVNVTMRENAKRIGEAASHGDLSENSEYKFALEERDFLRARLAQMNKDLGLAERIEPHIVPRESVGVGSRVTLRDLSDNSSRVICFFGPFDTDVDRGILNYKAPFGQQLMGMRVGERKTLSFDNRDREFEVLEIASGLGD